VKTLLVLSPDLAAGFDLERLKPLGSRSAVEARTRKAFGARESVRLDLGTDNPVRQIVVTLPPSPDRTLHALRLLCQDTGWQLFDRDAGRFLDVTAAEPLAPAAAKARPFQWWTGLPPTVRVLIGAGIAFLLFYIWVDAWVLSWH
jgi:hypothetical protein